MTTKRYVIEVTQDEYRAFQTVARCVGLFMPTESTVQLSDPWQPELEKWLANTLATAVKIKEILGDTYTPRNASRVARILVKLGWNRKLTRSGAYWFKETKKEPFSGPFGG